MVIRLFAVLAALLASAALTAFAGFLQNWTPRGVDTPGPFVGDWQLNALLLMAFCVGHSLLARPGIKQALFGGLNAKLSRSAYNLVTSVQLAMLMYFWTPDTGVLWQVDSFIGMALIYAVFGFGWFLLLLASSAIDPWHLFGLSQAFVEGPNEPPFSVRGPYRLVRHPIQTGLILAFWATPHMTFGHAGLAAFLTVYSVLATLGLEEHDLRSALGQDYEDYAQRVPALLPRLFDRRE